MCLKGIYVLLTILACSLIGGVCYPFQLHAQGNQAISISLVPQIGFNYSYYHLSSKAYRRNFRITTKMGGMRDFDMGIGLQLGLWDEWKALLTIDQTYIGGNVDNNFSNFSNLPKDAIFSNDKIGYSTSINLFALNFSKKVCRFRMGKIKGIQLSSELDVLFGAGVMWRRSNVVDKKSISIDNKPLFDTWHVSSIVGYVVTPTYNNAGILNIGASYHLYFNKKERFTFYARYSYGLHLLSNMDYKSAYYFDNDPTNFHESSIENFKAEIGRHQFTLSIGYPIALYRNKAEKSYLKEASIP